MRSLFIKNCIAYESRNFIPLIQLKFNTFTYGHNTIRYHGSKIWNNLSNNLKMSNGLSSFKKSIQKLSGPECHYGYCLQCTYIMSLYISSSEWSTMTCGIVQHYELWESSALKLWEREALGTVWECSSMNCVGVNLCKLQDSMSLYTSKIQQNRGRMAQLGKPP